ncbi:MAG: DUF1992 domain-containing protein [Desulfobulbaceae bacterium]|nr:DUF1992 domain-containing protein [Desulfobulbaceae bacterium]
MNPLSRIAERKISQAIEDGSLRFDKWKDKPLPEDDNDHLVPDDLKIAYKMLKNSGFLPPEIEAKKEIQRIEELIAHTEDVHVRLKQMKKLHVLLMKVDGGREKRMHLEAQADYYRKVVERISLHSQPGEEKDQGA